MRLVFRLTVIVLALFCLEGCKSHRAVVSDSTSVSQRPKVKAKSVPVVAALAENYSPWETFYVPFSMRISSPVNLSVSGRASMVRDEYIFLSMRMFGMEVATLYVDADSAFFADKYHKVLVAEPFAALSARTGLTLGDMQDILMGRAFYPGRGTLCSIDMPDLLFSPSDTEEDSLIRLTPRRIPAGALWYFTINQDPSLISITVEPDGYDPLSVTYSDLIFDTPSGSVASEVSIEASPGGYPISAFCRWDLKKARWNEPVSAPSLSFKGYKRANTAQLIESIRQ